VGVLGCAQLNVTNLLVECSAVQNRGIRESFYEAAKVALDVKPAGSASSGSSCIIQ
jgi:Rho family protein